MICALSASAPLRRVSAFRGWTEEDGIPVSRPEYHKDFAGEGMLKSSLRKPWKRFTDSGKDLSELPMLDEQEALIVKKKESCRGGGGGCSGTCRRKRRVAGRGQK